MPTAPQTPPQQRSIRRAAFLTAFDEETPDQPADLLASFKRPAKRSVKAKFTDEAKAAILNAVASHSWTTAREAYGWAWNELGLRVNYITVWRFLTAEGLLSGDTPRARRLRVVQ